VSLQRGRIIVALHLRGEYLVGQNSGRLRRLAREFDYPTMREQAARCRTLQRIRALFVLDRFSPPGNFRS